MALKTTLEQLEHVQTTIENIETDIASYEIGDVRVTRMQMQLKSLYERERYLHARYNREQAHRGRIRLNLSGGV